MNTNENAVVIGESKDFLFWTVLYKAIPVLFAKNKQTNEIFISYESIIRVMSRKGKDIRDFYSDEVLSWMTEFKHQNGYTPLMDLPEQCKQEARSMFGIITYRGIV